MEKQISKSALEVIQTPKKVLEILDKKSEVDKSTIKELPNDFNKELANELVIIIAESTSKEDAQFDYIYQAVKKKNEVATRDLATAIDYAGKAYEFVGDHWAEIFFVISYLNNKGYFDSLKKKGKFKAFFATLFEEDMEKDVNEDEKSG